MLFLINIKCTYIILCYNQYKERSHKVRKGGKLKTDEQKGKDGDRNQEEKVIKSYADTYSDATKE